MSTRQADLAPLVDDLIRDLGKQLIDGHRTERLNHLVLDIGGDLDHEDLDHALKASAAVLDHIEQMHKTAGTLHRLVWAIVLDADAEAPEAWGTKAPRLTPGGA